VGDVGEDEHYDEEVERVERPAEEGGDDGAALLRGQALQFMQNAGNGHGSLFCLFSHRARIGMLVI
jgi:hypothetical protein